jgi:hypothetical protein
LPATILVWILVETCNCSSAIARAPAVVDLRSTSGACDGDVSRRWEGSAISPCEMASDHYDIHTYPGWCTGPKPFHSLPARAAPAFFHRVILVSWCAQVFGGVNTCSASVSRSGAPS